MNKNLVTAALLGALTAPAMAGSVQLYGVIDAGLTHFSGLANGAGGTTTSSGLSSGVQSPSIIGIKGMEQLGPQFFALFDAETGFCATGNNQDLTTAGKLNSGVAGPQAYCSANSGVSTGVGFMQSQAYVALAGRFGMVAAGDGAPVIYRDEKLVDPFGGGMTGAITNLSLVSQFADLHQNQGVVYTTPNIRGFKAGVSYSFAPGAIGTIPSLSPATPMVHNVSRAEGAFARYTAGPLTAGIAWAVNKDLPLPAMLNPVTHVNDGSLTGEQIYGAYDFGAAKVAALYERATVDYNAGADTFAMLGVTIPLGRNTLLASYGRTRIDQGMQHVNLLSASFTAPPVPIYGTATQVALGWTYAFSKHTNLYASYSHIANDTHTMFAVGSASDGFLGAMGQSSTGYALGLRHQF